MVVVIGGLKCIVVVIFCLFFNFMVVVSVVLIFMRGIF